MREHPLRLYQGLPHELEELGSAFAMKYGSRTGVLGGIGRIQVSIQALHWLMDRRLRNWEPLLAPSSVPGHKQLLKLLLHLSWSRGWDKLVKSFLAGHQLPL